MQLKHGKTYISGEGTLIKIRKEKWDCIFLGFAVSNGTYMGQYESNGVSVEGIPEKANLKEIAN